MLVAVPKTHECWLVCGGRDFADQEMFDNVMSDLIQMRGCPAMIVHGAARGADSMADAWAKKMACQVVPVPAQWDVHGRAAGPMRNQKMLDRYRPHFVVAFPGGKGTADMIDRANKAGVTVAEVKARNGGA